jgi:hypothetical protein
LETRALVAAHAMGGDGGDKLGLSGLEIWGFMHHAEGGSTHAGKPRSSLEERASGNTAHNGATDTQAGEGSPGRSGLSV